MTHSFLLRFVNNSYIRHTCLISSPTQQPFCDRVVLPVLLLLQLLFYYPHSSLILHTLLRISLSASDGHTLEGSLCSPLPHPCTFPISFPCRLSALVLLAFLSCCCLSLLLLMKFLQIVTGPSILSAPPRLKLSLVRIVVFLSLVLYTFPHTGSRCWK